MRKILFIVLWMVCLQSVAQPAPSAKPEPNGIRNLYDAFGYEQKGTTLDWGFSALVRYNGKTILFDSGNDADTFEHNVKALGVDLKTIDFAVLSHRHNDHASGLDYLLKINPGVKLYLPDDRALGAPEEWNWPPLRAEVAALPKEQLYFRGDTAIHYRSSGRFWHANKEFVPNTKEIAPGVFLIVTESVMMGDFSKYPPNEDQPELTGFPELSLALMTSKGPVLIVGCSHSRVERIVAEAEKQLKSDVDLVMGGFHLLNYSPEYINNLAHQLKNDLRVKRVAPAHCTGVLAFKILKDVYGTNYSYAGLGSEVAFEP